MQCGRSHFHEIQLLGLQHNRINDNKINGKDRHHRHVLSRVLQNDTEFSQRADWK
jgi:hypothetical protein